MLMTQDIDLLLGSKLRATLNIMHVLSIVCSKKRNTVFEIAIHHRSLWRYQEYAPRKVR